MPNCSYREVRLRNPDKFDAWSYGTGGHLYNERVEVPADVSIVRGHPKGQPPKRLIPQALRFPTNNYTEKNIKNWLKKNKVSYITIESTRKGKVLTYKENVVYEAFDSLRRALEKAVHDKFPYSYVTDFSDKEVIIAYERDAPQGPSWETGKYTKIGYKLKSGEITFVGTGKEVEKKVTYEGMKIDGRSWAEMVLMDRFLREQEKENEK